MMWKGIIRGKRLLKDFCAWYLANIKSPATSEDMLNYIEGHGFRGNLGLSSNSISGRLRGDPRFKRIPRESPTKLTKWELATPAELEVNQYEEVAV